MEQPRIEKHTVLQSIILHILPGILIGCCYFLVRKPVIDLGYPSIMALVLPVALILIPFELGFLLYQAKKKTGSYSLGAIISYRDPIPWWQYILWVVIVFIAASLIFIAMKPVDNLLKEKLFFWMPGLDGGLNGNYSKSTLIVTYSLFFVFISVLGPLVEELYFRGYLLPRMKGKYAVLWHSVLFAAYHVFTPWLMLTRIISLLPLIYVVKKKNLFVGMTVHFLLNSIDVVAAVAFIARMT